MTLWEDRIHGHPAVAEIEALLSALDTAEATLDTSEAREAHSRLRNATRYLQRGITAADPELVAPAQLDRIQPELQIAREEVEAFASDGDVNRLLRANEQADVWLDTADALPMPARSDEAAESLVSFRRSAGQHLRNLEDQTTAFSERIEARLNEVSALIDPISAAITKLQEEAKQQESRLDSAIATHQQQFSDAEAQRLATFQNSLTEGRAGIDAAATEGKQALNELVTAAKTRVDEELASQSEQSRAVVSELEALRDDAVRLVSVIGNTGLTGDYQRIANNEQGSANRWRVVAILAFAVAALFNGVWLAIELWRDTEITTIVAVRLSITIPLLALGAYAIAESREHRHNERSARQMELQLASIGPYLAELDDPTQLEVRKEAFDRFFPGQPEARRLLAQAGRDT